MNSKSWFPARTAAQIEADGARPAAAAQQAQIEQWLASHEGRSIAEAIAADEIDAHAADGFMSANTPAREPGPIWTNGLAPAAKVTCPVWCTRHEHGGMTNEPHRIELLGIAVMDGELMEDVPLNVEILQALDSDKPMVVLEIGHALFQPTNVVLSRSDRARLAAVLLTANALTADQP